ncbi:MAG: DNA polymerase III subunit delta' [Planctomycetota bacterium]|nr:MAG: DNA polymerase III subunit delta' [Planctomycetota bacterium]
MVDALASWLHQQPELHASTRAALESAVQSGRLSRALLLSGPEGLGKAELARWLAQRLWCQAESAPCGSCPPCRKVLSGNHPDLEWLQRGADDDASASASDSKEINVAAVRALGGVLARAPAEAESRLAIVRGAEQLNEDAQNALLKLLEEPPGHSRLVLVSHQQEGLLDTVRSRCQELRVSPLGADEMAALFPDLDELRRELAGGRPGRVALLRAIQVDALLELVDATLAGERNMADFTETLQVQLEALAEACPDDDSDSVRRAVLDVMLARVVDLAWAAEGADGRPRLGALRSNASELPHPGALPQAAAALHEALGDLHRHLPARVAWLGLAQEFVAVGMVGG